MRPQPQPPGRPKAAAAAEPRTILVTVTVRRSASGLVSAESGQRGHSRHSLRIPPGPVWPCPPGSLPPFSPALSSHRLNSHLPPSLCTLSYSPAPTTTTHTHRLQTCAELAPLVLITAVSPCRPRGPHLEALPPSRTCFISLQHLPFSPTCICFHLPQAVSSWRAGTTWVLSAPPPGLAGPLLRVGAGGTAAE